jgi:hypothetical protein
MGARLSGFQLVKNEETQAFALSWEETHGLHKYKIDDGFGERFSPSPILLPSPHLDIAEIAKGFCDAAKEIDKDVFDNVTARLRELH